MTEGLLRCVDDLYVVFSNGQALKADHSLNTPSDGGLEAITA